MQAYLRLSPSRYPGLMSMPVSCPMSSTCTGCAISKPEHMLSRHHLPGPCLSRATSLPHTCVAWKVCISAANNLHEIPHYASSHVSCKGSQTGALTAHLPDGEMPRPSNMMYTQGKKQWITLMQHEITRTCVCRLLPASGVPHPSLSSLWLSLLGCPCHQARSPQRTEGPSALRCTPAASDTSVYVLLWHLAVQYGTFTAFWINVPINITA